MSTYTSSSPAIYSKTSLFINNGSSYIPIYGITSIGAPSFTKTEIDVSHMNSLNAKEYRAGALYDPGTLTFALQYAPTNTTHSLLVDHASTGSVVVDSWLIRYNDGSVWGFSGSLLSFTTKAENPAAGILTSDVSVRITGGVNFSASALLP
mgnify:CR=1 FL=1